MKSTFRLLLNIIFLYVFMGHSEVLGNHVVARFDYDVISEEAVVGKMSISVSKGAKGYGISTKRDINFSTSWGKVEIHSNLDESFSRSGVLLESDNMVLEGKKAFWVKTSSSNSELWGSSVRVKNVSEHDVKELAGLLTQVGGFFLPGAGGVMAIFSDSGTSRNNIRFPQDSYDSSLNNVPFYWLKNNKKLSAEIRILDCDDLRIYKMKTDYLGSDTFKVGEKKVSAQHYVLIPKKNIFKKSYPLHVWLAVRRGIPYFVQLKGKDADGGFTVRLRGMQGITTLGR